LGEDYKDDYPLGPDLADASAVRVEDHPGAVGCPELCRGQVHDYPCASASEDVEALKEAFAVKAAPGLLGEQLPALRAVLGVPLAEVHPPGERRAVV
jgi:hypothetical protein